MTAYYNEHDPFAAAWLRELIKDGLIAPGDVDERSIEDVTPNDVKSYTQVHWFAGIGGWSCALRLAGWADDKPVWTGSAPCQPFSEAGKRGGFADERHLWPSLLWHIRQCRPDVFFGEQVSSKAGLGWFDVVSADLEASDYSVGAFDLCAAGVGAFHLRQRLYFVANTASGRLKASDEGKRPIPKPHAGCTSDGNFWADVEWLQCSDGKQRPTKSGLQPVVDGFPNRVGILRGAGNAIVPQVAEVFIRSYMDDYC